MGVAVRGSCSVWEFQRVGVAAWWSCGVGYLWFGEVVVLGGWAVGELRCGRVAVWEICGVGELRCRGHAVCGGHGGHQTLILCILGISVLFRAFRKKLNHFQNSLQLNHFY